MPRVKPTHIVLDLKDMPLYLRRRLQLRGGVLIADQDKQITEGPWSTVYEPWMNSIRERMAKNSISMFGIYVRKFIGNLDGLIAIPTERQLALFINAQGIGYATRGMRRTALKLFFEYMKNAGHIGFNPVDNVKANWKDLPQSLAVAQPDPPFTQEEVDRMLARKRDFIFFWRWSVALAYYMGLRLIDVATIQWGAFQADALHLRTKKTGAVVTLPYDHPALGNGFIRQILAEMREYSKSEYEPDRVCWHRMAAAYNKDPNKLHAHFKKLLIRANIPPRGFQSLRRGCATRCHAMGIPLEQIGQFLGHSSTDQTKDYIHAPINRSELNGNGK